MILFVIFCLKFSSIFVAAAENSISREYPFLVRIYFKHAMNEDSHCGGVIVDKDLILTSAQCCTVVGDAYVVYGDTNHTNYVNRRNLDRYYEWDVMDKMVHGGYRELPDGEHVHDLCLMKLSKELPDDDGHEIISLPVEQPSSVTDCIVPGWGNLLNDTMQHVLEVENVYPKECQDGSSLCVKLEANCRGDGGNPIVCTDSAGKRIAYGVDSYYLYAAGSDMTCDDIEVNYFVNVYKEKDFLQRHVRSPPTSALVHPKKEHKSEKYIEKTTINNLEDFELATGADTADELDDSTDKDRGTQVTEEESNKVNDNVFQTSWGKLGKGENVGLLTTIQDQGSEVKHHSGGITEDGSGIQMHVDEVTRVTEHVQYQTTAKRREHSEKETDEPSVPGIGRIAENLLPKATATGSVKGTETASGGGLVEESSRLPEEGSGNEKVPIEGTGNIFYETGQTKTGQMSEDEGSKGGSRGNWSQEGRATTVLGLGREMMSVETGKPPREEANDDYEQTPPAADGKESGDGAYTASLKTTRKEFGSGKFPEEGPATGFAGIRMDETTVHQQVREKVKVPMQDLGFTEQNGRTSMLEAKGNGTEIVLSEHEEGSGQFSGDGSGSSTKDYSTRITEKYWQETTLREAGKGTKKIPDGYKESEGEETGMHWKENTVKGKISAISRRPSHDKTIVYGQGTEEYGPEIATTEKVTGLQPHNTDEHLGKVTEIEPPRTKFVEEKKRTPTIMHDATGAEPGREQGTEGYTAKVIGKGFEEAGTTFYDNSGKGTATATEKDIMEVVTALTGNFGQGFGLTIGIGMKEVTSVYEDTEKFTGKGLEKVNTVLMEGSGEEFGKTAGKVFVEGTTTFMDDSGEHTEKTTEGRLKEIGTAFLEGSGVNTESAKRKDIEKPTATYYEGSGGHTERATGKVFEKHTTTYEDSREWTERATGEGLEEVVTVFVESSGENTEKVTGKDFEKPATKYYEGSGGGSGRATGKGSPEDTTKYYEGFEERTEMAKGKVIEKVTATVILDSGGGTEKATEKFLEEATTRYYEGYGEGSGKATWKEVEATATEFVENSAQDSGKAMGKGLVDAMTTYYEGYGDGSGRKRPKGKVPEVGSGGSEGGSGGGFGVDYTMETETESDGSSGIEEEFGSGQVSDTGPDNGSFEITEKEYSGTTTKGRGKATDGLPDKYDENFEDSSAERFSGRPEHDLTKMTEQTWKKTTTKGRVSDEYGESTVEDAKGQWKSATVRRIVSKMTERSRKRKTTERGRGKGYEEGTEFQQGSGSGFEENMGEHYVTAQNGIITTDLWGGTGFTMQFGQLPVVLVDAENDDRDSSTKKDTPLVTFGVYSGTPEVPLRSGAGSGSGGLSRSGDVGGSGGGGGGRSPSAKARAMLRYEDYEDGNFPIYNGASRISLDSLIIFAASIFLIIGQVIEW